MSNFFFFKSFYSCGWQGIFLTVFSTKEIFSDLPVNLFAVRGKNTLIKKNNEFTQDLFKLKESYLKVAWDKIVQEQKKLLSTFRIKMLPNYFIKWSFSLSLLVMLINFPGKLVHKLAFLVKSPSWITLPFYKEKENTKTNLTLLLLFTESTRAICYEYSY